MVTAYGTCGMPSCLFKISVPISHLLGHKLFWLLDPLKIRWQDMINIPFGAYPVVDFFFFEEKNRENDWNCSSPIFKLKNEWGVFPPKIG